MPIPEAFFARAAEQIVGDPLLLRSWWRHLLDESLHLARKLLMTSAQQCCAHRQPPTLRFSPRLRSGAFPSSIRRSTSSKSDATPFTRLYVWVETPRRAVRSLCRPGADGAKQERVELWSAFRASGKIRSEFSCPLAREKRTALPRLLMSARNVVS